MQWKLLIKWTRCLCERVSGLEISLIDLLLNWPWTQCSLTKGNWTHHVWTMTDNSVNKRHEGSHLHLQPFWPNNTQPASQAYTHKHTRAGGVVVWAPLQSICCPVRRWTWRGGEPQRKLPVSVMSNNRGWSVCDGWEESFAPRPEF